MESDDDSSCEHVTQCVNTWTGDAQVDPVDTGDAGHQLQETFERCTSLATLDLPDTLTSIGQEAFMGCTNLATLDLPDTLASVAVGAFSDCTSLATLDLPDTLTSIGDGAFDGCTSLTTLDLPDALTSIGERAFSGCVGVQRVLMPDALALKITASEVFRGCPVLAGKGITLHTDVRLLRRSFWHPTMHAWCSAQERACVLALLVVGMRVDKMDAPDALMWLPHELWLLVLEFLRRRDLGAPPERKRSQQGHQKVPERSVQEVVVVSDSSDDDGSDSDCQIVSDTHNQQKRRQQDCCFFFCKRREPSAVLQPLRAVLP